MAEDLHTLGEELLAVSARVVRWSPKDGVTMSLASARLLARLEDEGPTKISTLATLESSSQPTITNHVQRLEAAGWVERSTDPTDARVSIIGLTAAGVAALEGVRDQVGTNLAPLLAQLPTGAREDLRRGIAAMRRLMSVPR